MRATPKPKYWPSAAKQRAKAKKALAGMARRALLLAAVALLAPSPAYAAWGKSKGAEVKAGEDKGAVTTTEDASAQVVKNEQKYEDWAAFNTYW